MEPPIWRGGIENEVKKPPAWETAADGTSRPDQIAVLPSLHGDGVSEAHLPESIRNDKSASVQRNSMLARTAAIYVCRGLVTPWPQFWAGFHHHC